MTPDNYEAMTDEQLSEAFAREVLGWKERDSDFEECQWELPDGSRSRKPDVATSADAVLPWLEKYKRITILRGRENWVIRVHSDDCADPINDIGIGFGHAPAFARAACIALLRAKRASPTPPDHQKHGHPQHDPQDQNPG